MTNVGHTVTLTKDEYASNIYNKKNGIVYMYDLSTYLIYLSLGHAWLRLCETV